MGLFDRFRSKPEEEPMFGYRSEPSGLEARPAAPPEAPGPFDLMRELQAADGNPDELFARLQQLFPGAQIDVADGTTVDASGDPAAAAAALSAFGFGAAPVRSRSSSASRRSASAPADAVSAAPGTSTAAAVSERRRVRQLPHRGEVARSVTAIMWGAFDHPCGG